MTVSCEITLFSEFAARNPAAEQFLVSFIGDERQFFPVQVAGVIAHQGDEQPEKSSNEKEYPSQYRDAANDVTFIRSKETHIADVRISHQHQWHNRDNICRVDNTVDR